MKWIPINWELIANPVNWAIILLMLAIGGIALHIVMPDYFNKSDS